MDLLSLFHIKLLFINDFKWIKHIIFDAMCFTGLASGYNPHSPGSAKIQLFSLNLKTIAVYYLYSWSNSRRIFRYTGRGHVDLQQINCSRFFWKTWHLTGFYPANKSILSWQTFYIKITLSQKMYTQKLAATVQITTNKSDNNSFINGITTYQQVESTNKPPEKYRSCRICLFKNLLNYLLTSIKARGCKDSFLQKWKAGI